MWLSDVPLDCNEDIWGDVLLLITVDLGESELADYAQWERSIVRPMLMSVTPCAFKTDAGCLPMRENSAQLAAQWPLETLRRTVAENVASARLEGLSCVECKPA